MTTKPKMCKCGLGEEGHYVRTAYKIETAKTARDFEKNPLSREEKEVAAKWIELVLLRAIQEGK